MLSEEQRRENYAYQPVAIGGFDSAKRDWQPTPAQARRLRKKANKAKGDHPRSRKQRWLNKLQQAIADKRKSLTEAQAEVMAKTIGERRADRDPQSSVAQEIQRRRETQETPPGEYSVVADKDGNPLDELIEKATLGMIPLEETPIPDEFKSLCPKVGCEPSAPDWACRTASGKKTKDHAGRVH